MYEGKNAVITAQNLIYAYQEELWDTNWSELESLDDEKLYSTTSGTEWKQVENCLVRFPDRQSLLR